MFEKYNESARRAMFFSRYDATRTGHQLIDSQHVLLGVLRENDPLTAQLWRAFEISPSEIYQKYSTVETTAPATAELPISEYVKKILVYAVDEASARQDLEVSPCHLILAILRLPESEAARVLHDRGVDYEIVSEIVRIFMQEAKRQAEIEERTPITLRASHYEWIDQLADEMRLREPRRVNRQTLVLAMMDAIAGSEVRNQRFSSLEDFRSRIKQALSGKWTAE